MKNILLIILTNLVLGLAAQVEIPAPKQTKKILLLNGTAHVGNGKIIENAAIAFEEGKLTMVDDATRIKIEFDHFDTIINIRDQHVYPGIIAPNSTLGITEIDAVRATNDFDEIGEFTPHVRSIIAYSTDSKITPTIRSNGVLMAQITPRGGVISGTSSIVQFDAWNWEDAIYKEDDGVHLNWSRMFSRWNGEKSKNYEKNYLGYRCRRICGSPFC